mmetsp:Transcript_16030/g.30792  ORF Transcript_16030/g.30792 Transcript_16030/m.30792 type:complete len:633 (-) Transcript_16030:346-2244(-)
MRPMTAVIGSTTVCSGIMSSQFRTSSSRLKVTHEAPSGLVAYSPHKGKDRRLWLKKRSNNGERLLRTIPVRTARAVRGVTAKVSPTASALSVTDDPQNASNLDWKTFKTEVLSGLTVSFALVPEATAFAFVAGVNPIVALYGASIMPLVTSLFGGRPGMISGAAGATAVCLTSLVASHGNQYLFATCILAGLIQIGAGVMRLGKFIRLVPNPVMLGFLNGLAIVIGMAQLEAFKVPAAVGSGMVWMSGTPLYVMIGFVGITMAVVQFLPKLTRAIPAPLAAIGLTTVLARFLPPEIPIRTVGDVASISGSIPSFSIPSVPLSWSTLEVVVPYAVAVATVGLAESLLTQQLVDELTETRSSTHWECIGQGLGNATCGFFGALGGCAMIGQTMVNMKSGGQKRLSGVATSAFIMLFVVVASRVIESVPLSALVGVMLMVVLSTFEWSSFKLMSTVPRSEAFVLVLVTVLTVTTNLAIAVGVGVVASCLAFAWKSAQRVTATRITMDYAYDGRPAGVYMLSGPLFFASTAVFKDLLAPNKEPLDDVVLDFMDCRVADASGVEAIDSLAERYKEAGKRLHLRHLSDDCRRLLRRSSDMVEVNATEDPWYGIATDYDFALGNAMFSPWKVPVEASTD